MKRREQYAVAILATVVLTFLATKGLVLPFGLILVGGAVALVFIRNEFLSLLAYILCNVLTVMIPDSGDRPIGMVLGLGIALLLLVWVVRIRVYERQPLSNSRPVLLLLLLFTTWAIVSSIIGVLGDGDPTSAVREFLSFSPLLLIPILYARCVPVLSMREKQIFGFVVALGIVILLWNMLHVRSAVLAAVSTREIGGAHMHETVPCLFFLGSLSFLGIVRKRSAKLITVLILCLSLAGLVITFRRTLYLATIPPAVLIVVLSKEDRRAMLKRLLLTFGALTSVGSYVFFSNPLFRTLLKTYGFRFNSSKHFRSDLSVLDRYSEWRDAWHASLNAPILGHGYGAGFKHYLLEGHHHVFRLFTHNSYLFYMFKTGFVGFVLLMAVYLAFLIQGFRMLRSFDLSSVQRAILRSALAYLILILIAGFTDTYLEHRPALIWVGLIWGYMLSLESRRGHNPASIQGSITRGQ